jgi:nicotinate-nucleotide adenylyltransferase
MPARGGGTSHPILGAVRTALFGGSFDPPHLGHLLCAVWAQAVSACDAVWILPAARHPYAKPLTPLHQRLALCRAAFAGLAWAEVRDDEARNPSGYTVDLVESLRAAHPQRQWLLVGGTDTAADLPNWHRGAELARLVEVIPVPRGGYRDGIALPTISSSAVRARLADGAGVEHLLPAAVAALIAREGWYRAAPDAGSAG